MLSHNVKGALLALAGFAAFSAQDAVVKILGETGYSPVQILFFSMVFGFPVITLYLIGKAHGESLRARRPWWTALRSAAVVAAGLCAFYSFSVLPLAQAYAIIFASPLMITLLAIPILGERVGLRRGLAVVAGLVGVLIVLRPGHAEIGLGHLAALGAAFSNALVSLTVRKVGAGESNMVLLIYPMIATFLVMGAMLPLVYVPMPLADLGGMMLVSTGALVAMALMILAFKSGEAAIVAPMQYSQMIWAVFYGWLLFDEGIDGATALGAGVIIASGLYIVFREGRVGAASRQPVSHTLPRVDAADPSVTAEAEGEALQARD